MADLVNRTGQLWKLTQVNGWYRITSWWQGEARSIDILNDGKNNHPWLATSGNFSGQFWKLTKL